MEKSPLNDKEEAPEKRQESGREKALLLAAAVCILIRLAIAYIPPFHIDSLYVEVLWVPAILAFFLLFFTAFEWLLDKIAAYVNRNRDKE